MTDQPTVAPTENVPRGILLSLLAIPLSIALFALVGGLLGGVSGIVAVVVPAVAAWLYAKGSGAALSRRSLVPVIVVSIVGIIVGMLVGIVATALKTFTAVGGDGGLSNPAFWTTVRNLFGDVDGLFPILLPLALGAVGIASVVRTARAAGTQQAASATPIASAAPTAPPATNTPPVPNAPSPGVILNGEPLDPESGKK